MNMSQDAVLIQLEGEENKVGGKNIIEAFEGSNSIMFNESYTVIGSRVSAHKIQALYDLTIIGDVSAEECVVNGRLTIIGDAKIATLSCSNSIFCQGNVYSSTVYCGGVFIANSVTCDEFQCDGNVIIRTTIDINQKASIEKSIVAYEGIIGAGSFSAENAIANEYFEFDGDVSGKVVELSTDRTICDTPPVKPEERVTSSGSENDLTLQDAMSLINKKIAETFSTISSLSEDDLLLVLRNQKDAIKSEFLEYTDIEGVFSKLVDLSYKDHIDSLEDYLFIIKARKVLPPELSAYETVEHVFSIILPKASLVVDSLSFKPSSIEEFINAISIVRDNEKDIPVNVDTLYNAIFEAIGLHYSTVKEILSRNIVTIDDSSAENEAGARDSLTKATEQVAPKEKKEDFLAKKISHVAKKYGITNSELERLATGKIKTCRDFVEATDEKLTNLFGKKAFLGNHLIQARDKMKSALDFME